MTNTAASPLADIGDRIHHHTLRRIHHVLHEVQQSPELLDRLRSCPLGGMEIPTDWSTEWGNAMRVDCREAQAIVDLLDRGITAKAASLIPLHALLWPRSEA